MRFRIGADVLRSCKAAVIGELGRDGEQTVDWRVKNEGKVSRQVSHFKPWLL